MHFSLVDISIMCACAFCLVVVQLFIAFESLRIVILRSTDFRFTFIHASQWKQNESVWCHSIRHEPQNAIFFRQSIETCNLKILFPFIYFSVHSFFRKYSFFLFFSLSRSLEHSHTHTHAHNAYLFNRRK